MRRAVIDLGTNTFNLLIADVLNNQFDVRYTTKEGVALGMGGINEQFIAPEAMQRALDTFARYMQKCDEFQVNSIRAIGTSAIRDASNANDLLQKVEEWFGVRIEVIDGLKEAQLIYDGVRWSYDFHQPSLIMDIGGGSTEFIRGHLGDPLQFCSLNIGVSRAVQLFDLADPLSEEDKIRLINWFETQAAPLDEFSPCTTLVGASGSFETFYEMIHEMPFPAGIEPIRLEQQELSTAIDWIIASTYEEREAHPYIIPIRRRMAPVAALKTKWVLERFGIREIIISPCSLKEGALKSG
jgi:exopolyphosphatase / guanosine-5'-triphosphate,3'-diphosphate pyrophosphatase